MRNLGFVYVYKTRSRKGTMRKMEVQREGKRNKRADCNVCVLRAKMGECWKKEDQRKGEKGDEEGSGGANKSKV